MIAGVFTAFAGWLSGALFSVTGVIVTTVVTVALILLEQLTGLVSAFGSFLLDKVLDVVVAFLTWLVGLLGDMPDAPPTSLQPIADFLGWSNQYLPVTEAIGLFTLYGTVVGLIFLYKVAKFIRGAG